MAGPAVIPVGKQKGGKVNQPPSYKFQKGGSVSGTGKAPDLYEKYDDKFMTRQARIASNTPIIILNNKTGAAMPNIPQPEKRQITDLGGSDMPSYSDIAQTYYRYVGGIKA